MASAAEVAAEDDGGIPRIQYVPFSDGEDDDDLVWFAPATNCVSDRGKLPDPSHSPADCFDNAAPEPSCHPSNLSSHSLLYPPFIHRRTTSLPSISDRTAPGLARATPLMSRLAPTTSVCRFVFLLPFPPALRGENLETTCSHSSTSRATRLYRLLVLQAPFRVPGLPREPQPSQRDRAPAAALSPPFLLLL